MAAVIRVKRRCDEEPLDALILNCKRRKTEETTEEDVDKAESTLLKFAGTQINQEEDIFKHIKKSTKAELEEQYKKHFVDIKEKIREQTANASKNSRYKIVNLCRSDQQNAEDEVKPVTIVDIETNDVPADDIEISFVYDLYYTTSDHLDEFYESDLVSVYPLSEPLVYGSHRGNDCNDSDDNESEDSNDENNWRNDYPDEEDGDSITEDDMLNAMNKVTIDDTLSSDDGQEGFIYSIDSEAAGFEEDIDESDVNRYGEQYARFKARNKSSDDSSDHTYCQNYDEDDEPELYD